MDRGGVNAREGEQDTEKGDRLKGEDEIRE